MSTQATWLAEYAAQVRLGTGVFWSRLKRWFLAAAAVGAIAGLAVAGLEWTVSSVWSAVAGDSGPTPLGVFLLPIAAGLLSGLCLRFLTVNPGIHGTEEYIQAYHERGGVFRFRSVPGKLLAAAATLGLGGSAGMEGPSIYAGSAIGAYVLRITRKRLGFTDEDVRILMVAGAAAGVSAIFKAPLTGIIFALEVPYRDDLAHEALVPSLVSSVTSYLVLVQFAGVRPLFVTSDRYTMAPLDLVYALGLGLAVGLAARVFVWSFHTIRRFASTLRVPLWVRTAAGGVVAGALGWLALTLVGRPVATGIGYDTINALMAGEFTAGQAGATFLLKAGATIALLASGAAGGIFIPMIMLGANLGALVRAILPGTSGALFPVVGMAAFLAAGYNTPIAAAVFVAETTGGAGYIIPGLVGAAVAFAVAGDVSVSDQQRWRRESRVMAMMRRTVAEVMTRTVLTVPDDVDLETFVGEYVVRTRHKSMPVVDGTGRLTGVVALSDVRAVDPEARGTTLVRDVMVRDLVTVTPDTLIGDAVIAMSERDVDRVPVVDPAEPDQIRGVLSTTDVRALEAASDAWQAHDTRGA